jgi:hypothetical protein
MYPLAHLYFANKALQELSEETILGSLFPDIVFFSGFEWHYSHSLGQDLWHDFHRSGVGMVNFCRGVISHGITPQGLDYYSDQKYRDYEKGYCYEKARPLVNGVVEACKISSGDGWWKAHNFIEMGVELFVFEKCPELLHYLQEALSNTTLIRNICSKIAPSLGKEGHLLERGYLFFKDFIELGPMDARSLALRYQEHIFLRHSIDSVNLVQCENIIERGKEIIASDIDKFFNDVRMLMLPIWNQSEP